MMIWKTATIILIIVLVLVGSLLGYLNIRTSTNLTNTKTTLSTTRITLADTQSELSTTQSQLSTTQAQLSTTRSQLNTTQSQLATTQNELAANQSKLTTTQNELTEAQAEITTLENTDTGQVISAKEPLGQFLSYAKSGNYSSMWDMLHPDSQKNYNDESDFASNNVVDQENGLYTLDSYYIGSGQILTTWGTYSNVVEIQVVLVEHEDALASLILSLIGIGDLIPAADITTWDAHLVIVGNVWEIFCERQNSSPSPTPTPTPTQVTITYTSSTASQIGTDYPSAGNIYLVVNMSIQNHGSSNFTVYPDTFSVTVAGVQYNCSSKASHDIQKSLLYNWAGSGGPLKGNIVFEVPAGTTAFSMNYAGDAKFNIEWVPQ